MDMADGTENKGKKRKLKIFLRVLVCIIAILAVIALLCTGLSMFNQSKAYITVDNNLIDDAVLSVENGEIDGSGFSGSAGDTGTVYTAEFSDTVTLNTVTLREDGTNCCGFTIEARIDGEYEQIYAQDDRIGDYRYCAFSAVETDAIRITIESADNAFVIEEVEAFESEAADAEDFRVTAYITAAVAYDMDSLSIQAGSFDVITDVIFFGGVYFTEEGTLYYPDLTLDDGTTVDGETVFETAIANLREVIGDRDVRLHCNFLGPDASEDTPEDEQSAEKCELHNMAFGDNRDTLIEALIQCAEENDFDGIYFDYEYPRTFIDWFTYSRFLSALKSETDGKYQIGAAMPVWKNLWEILFIGPLDVSEVMGYDSFDSDGYHASFSNTASSLVKRYLSLGYSAEDIDLGMPFYARPTDGGLYWYSYSTDAQQLGKYNNVATWSVEGREETQEEDAPDRYYNSWQMIYDKTAYALDAGLGGVMVWNYSYDLPYEDELSLFGAIAQAIEDRSA